MLAADPQWAGPPHLPLEVLRTLRRLELSSVLDRGAAASFAAEVVRTELRCPLPDPELLSYVWEHRHDLSPYDAPYVALARRHQVPLVTHDARLARAAGALGVDVLVP